MALHISMHPHPSLCTVLIATIFFGCHPPSPKTNNTCDVSAELSALHDRTFRDETGEFVTQSTLGSIDLTNGFFQSLGTNGRRCVSCHVPSQGWTITPSYLHDLFERTAGGICDDGHGLSAVFRPNDGAVNPGANMSTLMARRVAYSLLLTRGLIRIELPIPPGAEFTLVTVDDPYHFANAEQLSLFRRPLPTTNLKFDSAVMWDDREAAPGAPIISDLLSQASTAVVIHAQGAPLSDVQRAAIVTLETSLVTAQSADLHAGRLDDGGARGGPSAILAQPFHIGINDNFGDPITGSPFSPIIFSLYDRWTEAPFSDVSEARRMIARGQSLFNSKPILISGVSGINDEAAFGKPEKLSGTCGTCPTTRLGAETIL